MDIKLKKYQDNFLFSQKRFPALVCGVGTGKTFMLLLKIWTYCEQNPDSLALVVRKEFSDLRDSTMKDFTTYFGVTADSNKEYHFPNKSVIMFRHASEVNVLKNVNLSIAGIEQAEEFETDETFTFIRDRLRRKNGPYRQLCVIANACGHNWIWRLWVNNPTSDEYQVGLASTFDNEDNLPKDFLADLRDMEISAPNHYKQYVLNSFEEVDADDLLFTYKALVASANQKYEYPGMVRRILSADIARYGEDESVFDIIESKGVMNWEQTHQEHWKQKSLMETTGKIIELQQNFRVDLTVIDDDGLGGGVTDRLTELKRVVIPFRGGTKATKDIYANLRTEAFFFLADKINAGYFKILNDTVLIDQLLTIRFRYKSDKQKMLVPKEEMRKEGIKSPDRADALMMGAYHVDRVIAERFDANLPREADSGYRVFRHAQ